MSRESNQDWKINANKKRIRSLIVTELAALIEIYDDTAVAILIENIRRSRGEVEGVKKDGTPKYRDPHYLKDEEYLKRIENLREEMDRDALNDNLNEEEND